MSWESLFLVLAIHAVALVSPGPDFAVVTRLSIASGRKTGLWAAGGVATADQVIGGDPPASIRLRTYASMDSTIAGSRR